MSSMIAPKVLDEPINGDWFEALVNQVLIPELKPDDVVIVDNLSSHKRASVNALIRELAPAACSCRLTAPTLIR